MSLTLFVLLLFDLEPLRQRVWRIFKKSFVPFFQMLRIFPRALKFFFKCAHFPHISLCGAFCKSDAFFQVWRIFPSVSLFCKCAAFFQVYLPHFLSVAHFSKCALFSKCGAFFQGWRIFQNEPSFPKCGVFCQVYRFLSSMSHFSKCGEFFSKNCRIIFPSESRFFQSVPIFFLSAPPFSKCGASFQELCIFPSMAHFSK